MENLELLKSVLTESPRGLRIIGRHLLPKEVIQPRPIPYLKHYMMDEELAAIRDHNIAIMSKVGVYAKFAFAWLMLPTGCNQRCAGCFEGNDKREYQSRYSSKQMFSRQQLDEMFKFLKSRGAKMIAYGGIGELFTMTKARFGMNAFDYIDYVLAAGFEMLIFTNGTLLDRRAVKWLAERPISLIVSMRDTREWEHNRLVGIEGFRKTLRAVALAMEYGLPKQHRLAVEMPVIHGNEEQILFDFIPAMRHLGIIPFVEQYIQLRTSVEERQMALNFLEVREFFYVAQAIERLFGYHHQPVWGQRMLSQPKCERYFFSFAVYPDGTVTSCPSQQKVWGNLNTQYLHGIFHCYPFYSTLADCRYCACSRFFTEDNAQIPNDLPEFLKEGK